MSQLGFWDWEDCQSQLNRKKGLLVRLNEIVDRETIRTQLERIHDNSHQASSRTQAA